MPEKTDPKFIPGVEKIPGVISGSESVVEQPNKEQNGADMGDSHLDVKKTTDKDEMTEAEVRIFLQDFGEASEIDDLEKSLKEHLDKIKVICTNIMSDLGKFSSRVFKRKALDRNLKNINNLNRRELVFVKTIEESKRTEMIKKYYEIQESIWKFLDKTRSSSWEYNSDKDKLESIRVTINFILSIINK
ncbi:MAG: hypothetical protein COX80_03765 [Candidatus Magasanikbacteria bacterium CG_4_10_14_0_2_um_filter_33_14]|uniref:Uncharacterized protein n=1 Tax=Candidatus Magasanikbacteria bacterium CG_4_10_14_0_2_um_filter_33_14 TaxID=1974636 RepID=A0A2M7V9V3_9BACT|nr:MAG: hypothetical protein COX80_03765 [Candidatus Magasanikbacteria bacterium CG_4_10_14_0_2_um_filter_33_14]